MLISIDTKQGSQAKTHNNLARFFAICADEKFRQQHDAVELARRALGGFQDRNSAPLDMLSVSYAEAIQSSP